MHWLVQPAAALQEPLRGRANLLGWLHLFIIPLAIITLIVVLVTNPAGTPRRNIYVELVLGLLVLLILAFGLNRTGRYDSSAGLTVASAILGTWGSMLLDPNILQGDLVPLTYVAVSVLLASILLPTAFALSLAALQLGGLILVMLLLDSGATAANWPSLLTFIFLVSGLSIVANVISQRDRAQIENQARQLAISEALLREQSIRDYLTNLFNRRYMQETLEREIERATRKHYPVGIIMLDVDYFKRFNDTLGHAAGDALLREVGKLLSTHVRRSDVACRYGGEEFVLILPEAGWQMTLERAEQLRAKAKFLQVEHKDEPSPLVTFSLGVAVFPDHGAAGEVVLRSADAALYRAKLEGRDRVVVADRDPLDEINPPEQ